MLKTVFVGFKFPQMGKHSGYDLVRDHAGYDEIVDCQISYDRLRNFLEKKNIVSKLYERLIGSRLWWVEFNCLLMAIFEKNIVFHFVYAENIYRYLGWFKWLGFKVVCTYHQPISYFNDHPEFRRGLSRVDEILVLSEDVVPAFKIWKGDDRTHFIPHGVDTDFFCPDHTVRRCREILMVGNWLRNFEFAASVFIRLLTEDLALKVYVVVDPVYKNYFPEHERLYLISNITDNELLLRYRSAAMMFLPLNGFVANNSVLEAVSVGCPLLIASDQIPSDALPSVIDQIPLNLGLALIRIKGMLEQSYCAKLDGRNWIMKEFNWQKIGKITYSILSCDR